MLVETTSCSAECCVLRIAYLGGDPIYSVDEFDSFKEGDDVLMTIE
jgi:hypothetical protein